MSEYMKIIGTFEGWSTGNPPEPISADQATAVGKFLATDATDGTFAPLEADYWTETRDLTDELARVVTDARGEGKFAFELELNSDLFPPADGGLQHLLGIFSGDLFNLQLKGMNLRSFNVEKLEFPELWKSAIQKTFREGRAHTTKEIRAAFNLKPQEPLLAFSIKPRIGLKLSALRDISLGVLREGFHIVELDTRYLKIDDNTVSELLKLAKDAVSVGTKHVTRFSPNLSAAGPSVVEVCDKFMSLPQPVVIKIDGGLDGISTTQTIRKRYKVDGTPIITCYPLLKRTLEQRLGQDTFLQSLIWSGSDIIYPGGAPNLGGTSRAIDHSSSTALAKSVDRYLGFVQQGAPMVTVAGGIYAGQLQAYYELLGPNVAYFLGGGVALHKDGPIEGAKLCVEIIKNAQELRASAGKDWAQDLPDKLQEKAQDAYDPPAGADDEMFGYISPSERFKKAIGLKPWVLQTT